MKSKVVLLYSGGMDSYYVGRTIAGKYEVHAITFLYGQTNSIEVDFAKRGCEKFGFVHKVVDISSAFNFPISSMLKAGSGSLEGKKETFVPNRNLLFLTVAYNYALSIGAKKIFFAIYDEVFSFADATFDFVDRLQGLFDFLHEGKGIVIELPILYLSKEYIYGVAEKEGYLVELLKDSYSCYSGELTENNWGIGCGKCYSCTTKKKQYDNFLANKK